MLTGFQLRAARGVLDLYNKDLAKKIGIHSSTLVRLEEKTSNLSYLRCNLRTSILLSNFFENAGIVCNDNYSLSLKSDNKLLISLTDNNKLSRFQLKASRISMNLSQKDLGAFIDIPQSTISDLETNNNNYELLHLAQDIQSHIIQFFNENGIIFPNIHTIVLNDDPAILSNQQKRVFDTEN